MLKPESAFLSAEQIDFFNRQGYLKLPHALPQYMLKALRKLFDEQMQKDDDTGTAVNYINGTRYVGSIEKLCRLGNLQCLELLGSPFILQIAKQICGPDFFLIQEFAVIKNLGDNVPVLWHQDMLHRRSGRCFTMGIYLDDANEGDGALRIVPKSHTAGKPICELKEEPSIEMPMKAGDILLHDMMLAHSSGLLQENELRRVLYFEFLSVTHVLQEKLYEEKLLHSRMWLLELAIQHYRQRHPEKEYFDWKNPYPQEEKEGYTMQEALDEIYGTEVHAIPSTYCFE